MPRPLLFRALVALGLSGYSSAIAQDPVRPWLDWRTLATPNYRFHYPRELEDWTREVAARVESVDSAIVAHVGYAPTRPIHVVVDDPFGIANGYALPFIDRPVSVWWAVPPDPRSAIGNYVTWGEMLSAHELTHIAHLTRPSRNPWQRQLWSFLPANLGPITRKSPRWLYEGYATMIEGEITGTGRPNNVWRPAILRQWAIEGRLPTYGQLSAWSGDYDAGEFAYVGGSAFLEWLAKRQGDSSLVLVWRRMTARIVRGFDASFMGVYGDAPATLYGRHVAELTRDAMAAKAELERAEGGLVEGELVQHLSWDTGDPAVSPNGARVAVTLRERDRPSRVVIWNTAPEPRDTAAERRRLAQQGKDPQDVPDRRFYPAAKKPVKTLLASNGRSYGQPRWLADNRRVVVTRWAPLSDRTLRPDLYIWDTGNGAVNRVTHGSGVLNADPHPNAHEAVAMRCRAGHCDVARVDLTRGTTTTLLEGNPRRSYYRPRYSPDGSRFVASVSESGRWRIVIADRDGSNVRYVDPSDGANRYDAQWLPGTGDSLLVAVSERGGIPNLEIVNTLSASARALTRVTGAAVAPDVNPQDSSIWFLSLHSRGFDVRRAPSSLRRADTVVAITSERFGFAGLHAAAPVALGARSLGAARPYGAGPRHQRWLPGGYYSADGAGGFITVFSGDIVGRFNATAVGAYGEPGTWQGGSLRSVWRHPRPAIEFGAQAFIHEPSSGRFAQPAADSLDASLMQSIIAVSRERIGDGWRVRGRLGGGAGVLDPRFGAASHFRGLGFGELELGFAQSSGSSGIAGRLRGHVTHGQTRATYQRMMSSLELETTGRDAFPLELSATFGRVIGSPHPFELLTIGGALSPIADSSLLSQRYSMPMFPTGIAVGKALLAWRVAFPAGTWTWFYEGASATSALYAFSAWNRAVGVDMRYALPIVPVAFAPRIEARGGAAYTLDAPFRRRIRVFLEMKMEP